MKTKISTNGNVHIPLIMKKNLGIENNSQVNIECTGDKIIITNDKQMRSREEIEKFLAKIQKNEDDISNGMKVMGEWVLREEYKDLEEE